MIEQNFITAVSLLVNIQDTKNSALMKYSVTPLLSLLERKSFQVKTKIVDKHLFNLTV